MLESLPPLKGAQQKAGDEASPSKAAVAKGVRGTRRGSSQALEKAGGDGGDAPAGDEAAAAAAAASGGGGGDGGDGDAAEVDHLLMLAHEDLREVLEEHTRWQEAQRLVRHMDALARADANLEVAWLAAEAGERRAAEAAGAAAREERRIRMKMARPAAAAAAVRFRCCRGEGRLCVSFPPCAGLLLLANACNPHAVISFGPSASLASLLFRPPIPGRADGDGAVRRRGAVWAREEKAQGPRRRGGGLGRRRRAAADARGEAGRARASTAPKHVFGVGREGWGFSDE